MSNSLASSLKRVIITVDERNKLNVIDNITTANGVLIGNDSDNITGVEMSEKGDILIGAGDNNNPSILGLGTDGQVLTVNNGIDYGVEWKNLDSDTSIIKNDIKSSYLNNNTWNQLSSDINGVANDDQSGYSVSLSADGSIVAIGAPFNDNAKGQVRIFEWNGSTWVQRGNAINGAADYDQSGYSISLSADGSIVAIGAPFNNNSNNNAGQVRIFKWNGNNWVKRGDDIDGAAEYEYDQSGYSVSLSADGTIVAIGAPNNNGAVGYVRIFEYDANKETDLNQNSNDFGPAGWRRLGQDINGEANGDQNGKSVSLSADGTIVAIGAPNNENLKGKVRIFEYDANKETADSDGPVGWRRLGQDINEEANGDQNGKSVSLSADGTIVAIGAPFNDNAKGQVRIFKWNGDNWVQRGDDIDGAADYDHNGYSVSLSADGNIVAIGAPFNNNTGQVRIFKWNGGDWVQIGSDINGVDNDQSGYSVSLSADGTIVAIGAPFNNSSKGQVKIYTLGEYINSLSTRSITFSNLVDTVLGVESASGTDTAGKDLTIAAGQGTGTGAGGSIIFQTADGGENGENGENVNSLATAMTITDDGNVGIGTTSPSTNLQIYSQNLINSVSDLTSAFTTSNYPMTASMVLSAPNGSYATGGNVRTYFGNYFESGVGGGTFIQASNVYEDSEGSGNLDHVDELLLNPKGGNVGIGTTNPSEKLDIIPSNTNDCFIRIRSDANNAGKSGIKFTESGHYGFEMSQDASNDYFKIVHKNSSDNIDIDNILVIQPGGNVGIGTTNPNSKLAVNGNINISGPLEVGGTAESKIAGPLTVSGTLGVNGTGNSNIRGSLSVQSGVWGTENSNIRGSLSVQSGIGITSSGNHGYVPLTLYTQNGNGYWQAWWQQGPGTNNYNLAISMWSDQINNNVMIGYFENSWAASNHTFFTGQHRNLMNISINETHIGLIVCSNGVIVNSNNELLPSINESLPICVLTSTDNEKTVFGVISDKEDTNDSRSSLTGSYKTVTRKQNKNEQRIFINSLGEGSVWVCNKNGNLQNGDYITSTTVTGYGGKQTTNADFLMNYTVAKITCDCDFSLTKIVKQKLKVIITNTTKERDVYENVEKTQTKIVYDEQLQRYIQKTTTETSKEQVFDTVNLYNESGDILGTHKAPRKKIYTETSTDIVYDSNGDPQFEDDLDENGNQQMVYPLETRFLQADGTQLTDEADYNTRLGNGEEVYIACFVGCTYHCG